MVLAVVLTWHLILMPLAGGPGPSGLPLMTDANKDLFKPFDTGRTFDNEESCKADGRARLTDYLRERGLPDGATANIACSLQ